MLFVTNQVEKGERKSASYFPAWLAWGIDAQRSGIHPSLLQLSAAELRQGVSGGGRSAGVEFLVSPRTRLNLRFHSSSPAKSAGNVGFGGYARIGSFETPDSAS